MNHLELLSDEIQPQLGVIFANTFKNYPWSSMLEPFYARLQCGEKLIFEKLDGRQPFSDELWNLCFERMNGGEFWHHTHLENLENILTSGEMWLHPVEKRMGESELVEFASSFGYRGLFDVDETGERVVDQQSKDLFYLSLTSEEGDSELWNYGEVRMRFRISPVSERAELRKMTYAVDDNHPLRLLRKFSETRFHRHFLPWGVSRMGAFLLDPFYNWEKEVRLLIKRFNQTTDLNIKKAEEFDVIAIPIDTDNSRVILDLLRIEADSPENCEKLRAMLTSTKFSHVTVGVQK